MLSDTLIEFIAEYDGKADPDMLLPYKLAAEKVKDPATGRYVLDRAAVAMIQNLTLTKRSSFVAALPLCRLRDKAMWVEFAFGDRADWQKHACARGLIKTRTHDNSGQPQRLGFLIEQDDVENDTYLRVTPLWIHEPPLVDMGYLSFRLRTSSRECTFAEFAAVSNDFTAQEAAENNPGIDVTSPREVAARRNLAARIDAIRNPLFAEKWKKAESLPKVRAKMEEDGHYDLASEWHFVMALLIAFNSRNVIDIATQPTDFGKLNKARVKKGKPPLLNHRPITLNLSKVQKRRVIEYVKGNGRARDALGESCYIPGHFKVRKTGVFWWSAHRRGGQEPEFSREYRVTA